MYSCFLFDLDNTLIISEPIIFASLNHVSEKYTGKRYTPDQIRSMYGPPESGMVAAIVKKDVLPEAIESFYQFYETHHQQHVQIIPGMDEALKKLHAAGTSMAIITGKGRRSTETTLRLLGLRQFFAAMITGEGVKRWKPDPEPALLALRILTKSAADTLFMGDQLADLGCARSAGIHFAAALWESFQVAELVAEKPEWIFQRPDDFYSWIDREIGLRMKS